MDVDKIISNILTGDFEDVKRIIEKQPEKVNQTSSAGVTFLMAACEQGNERLITLLADSGADLNITDEDGLTALHYAVKNHQIDAVASLVSRGTNVNKKDSKGNTPLHLAVEKNYKDVVEVLLSSKGNTILQVNQKNNRGCTPLHLASSHGHTDTTELLLQQNGTDVRAVTIHGWTPLHLASQEGHTDTIKLLLQQNGIDANKMTKNGDTPLHVAVRKQHYDVVTLMLSQDSVKLDIENHKKMTPLLEAVSSAHLGIIHKLITHGANIHVVDNDGNNCLHLGVREKMFHSEVEHIHILDECCTELQLDKRLSGIVVVSYLASQGASLYHRNDEKVTPLDSVKDQHLKEKLETFLRSLCRWCQEKKATVTLQPCQHTVICQDCCSQMTFKQCPICRQHIRSKSGFETVKFEQEVLKTSQQVERLNLEENRSHSTSKKLAVEQQQVETPELEEKLLQVVAQLLGSNWQQVGRHLGIRNVKLETIRLDNPLNTNEQSFQMLHKWYTSCDQEKRTLKTLREALEAAECFEALQCLPSEEK